MPTDLGFYISRSAIDAHLTPQTVVAIYDDHDEGEPAKETLELAVRRAEGYVDGFLRQLGAIVFKRLHEMNPPGGEKLGAGVVDPDELPSEVERIALDVFEAYAIRRHPQYIRGDWRAKLKDARADLMDLVTAKTRLNIESDPEPTHLVGTTVRSGDPDDTAVKPKFFVDGLGDF